MRWPKSSLSVLAVLLHAGPSASAAAPQELVLFEAASLKQAFASLAVLFESAHPGWKVVANAAGSQELTTQLEHGATADVFASADLKHMEKLRRGGLVQAPITFTCNVPVLVVRPGSPVKSFGDLPQVERLVLGAPEVPIGAYTAQILANASASRLFGPAFGQRVQARVVSRELNVRQVLAKVTLGEADAGIVYRTDAWAANGKVVTIPIPEGLNVVAEYPIAALAASQNGAAARDWISLVTSPKGKAVLAEHGFIACPPRR